MFSIVIARMYSWEYSEYFVRAGVVHKARSVPCSNGHWVSTRTFYNDSLGGQGSCGVLAVHNYYPVLLANSWQQR